MATEGSGLSVARRHALGKLSELFAKEQILHSRIVWISQINGTQCPPEFVRSPRGRVSRDEYFLLLSALVPHPGFNAWLVDLLEVIVGVYSSTRSSMSPTGLPLLVRPSRQECRKLILQGSWGWDLGVRAIQLLGYDLQIGKSSLGDESFVLRSILSEPERNVQQGRLRESLAIGHNQALLALDGAYDAYLHGGPDSKRQAMDSLRNALENLVRDYTGKDLGSGLEDLSTDDSKRLRLLKSLRDFLSVEGTHASDQPLHDDFYFAVRVTEDTMVWILQRKGEWR